MAEVTIPYQPQLTTETAMEVFTKYFAGRYKVEKYGLQVGRSFILRKNAFVGVTVGLRRREDISVLVFTGTVPFPGMLALFPLALLGLVPYFAVFLILRSNWKPLEEEVREFTESAPEFRGAWPATDIALPTRIGSVTCASCGTPLAENAQFCQTCGAAALVPKPEETPAQAGQVYCSECGAAITASGRFCHGCGAAVATLKGEDAQAAAPADSLTPEAPAGQGCCAFCGLELGVNEKMQGLAVHERCATPAFEASADTPANH